MASWVLIGGEQGVGLCGQAHVHRVKARNAADVGAGRNTGDKAGPDGVSEVLTWQVSAACEPVAVNLTVSHLRLLLDAIDKVKVAAAAAASSVVEVSDAEVEAANTTPAAAVGMAPCAEMEWAGEGEESKRRPEGREVQQQQQEEEGGEQENSLWGSWLVEDWVTAAGRVKPNPNSNPGPNGYPSAVPSRNPKGPVNARHVHFAADVQGEGRSQGGAEEGERGGGILEQR